MQTARDLFEGLEGESLEAYSEVSSTLALVKRQDSTRWKSMNDDKLNKLIRDLCVGFANLQGEVDELKKGNSLSISIYDLNNSKFQLKVPMSVLVYQEDGIFYTEPADFEIFGEGETEKDAINNFKEVIVVYFENLRNSKEKLSKKLSAKLKLLEKMISCEN
ncbi:MAG: hypothetical protein ABIA91_01585 [Patescibacteria group bacterium]